MSCVRASLLKKVHDYLHHSRFILLTKIGNPIDFSGKEILLRKRPTLGQCQANFLAFTVYADLTFTQYGVTISRSVRTFTLLTWIIGERKLTRSYKILWAI
jgi:hypothetical protein